MPLRELEKRGTPSLDPKWSYDSTFLFFFLVSLADLQCPFRRCNGKYNNPLMAEERRGQLQGPVCETDTEALSLLYIHHRPEIKKRARNMCMCVCV